MAGQSQDLRRQWKQLLRTTPWDTLFERFAYNSLPHRLNGTIDDPIRSIRYGEQLPQAEADLAELNAKLG